MLCQHQDKFLHDQRLNTKLPALHQSGVVTSSGRHEADVVVLAAGLGVPRLAAQLGADVPLADKAGTLTILTQPMPGTHPCHRLTAPLFCNHRRLNLAILAEAQYTFCS